jgi:hypothetical protein
MPILSQIEWRIEGAWIAVLTEELAVTVRRFNDLTAESDLPFVTVHCESSECPDDDLGTDQVELNISAYTSTDKDGDLTGEALHDLLGQIRDIIRSEPETDLSNAVSGLHVYNTKNLSTRIPPIDGTRERVGAISISHYATCTDTLDTPEEE